MTEIALNSALEQKVRDSIEPGWWVRLRREAGWCLVVRAGEPLGNDIKVMVDCREFWRPMEDVTAAKPRKHAEPFLFGQSDTVTREEAEGPILMGAVKW
ncbi:MAG: hypothetical protein HQ582_22180, partial [Planctomycetes bacterium]|nr:hypothetical protein [Planctomycetota bacterium]